MIAPAIRVIAAVLGVILVTVLYFRSQVPDVDLHDKIVDTLRLYRQIDATLNQDLLETRYGFLQHYDTVNANIKQLFALHGRLANEFAGELIRSNPAAARILFDMEDDLTLKRRLTEKYISQNAVYLNSFRYFPVISNAIVRRIGKNEAFEALHETSEKLAVTILTYNNQPSAELKAEAMRESAVLQQNRSRFAPDHAKEIENLIRHANIILAQKPVVDDLLERILSVHTSSLATALLTHYQADYKTRLRKSQVYRFYLYIVAVALTVYIGWALIQLKATTMKLQRTVADLNYQKFALDQHSIVSVTDPHGRITYVNDRFCDVSLFRRDEILGKTHRILNSHHHPPEFFAGMWHTINRGEVWNGQIHNRRKDGTDYWVETTIVPFLDERQRPYQFVEISTDITEQKNNEAELERYHNHLEDLVAQRTAQLRDANDQLQSFSYSVAHDLRSPLRSIDGFSQILLEDYQDRLDDTGRHYLQRMRNATQRMGQLIDDLLTLARVNRKDIEKSRVDIGRLAAEVAQNLQQIHPERRVRFVVKPAVARAYGDPQLLRVVMENLINNAWKFTGKCAEAVIEFGCLEDASPPVFYVRDNGVGFNMSYAQNLFKPFQRLHPHSEFEGTGIGLATVHRILSRHGGRIWGESQPDQGAVFYFTLPQEPVSRPSAPAAV